MRAHSVGKPSYKTRRMPPLTLITAMTMFVSYPQKKTHRPGTSSVTFGLGLNEEAGYIKPTWIQATLKEWARSYSKHITTPYSETHYGLIDIFCSIPNTDLKSFYFQNFHFFLMAKIDNEYSKAQTHKNTDT